MSLCNQILDVADDVNKAILSQIVKETPPPALVKTAQIATRESKEKLSREDFALVLLTKEGSELRKYPISDAANTWLSCRYFEKTASKLPKMAIKTAAVMLKRACALFGVDESKSLAYYLEQHKSNPTSNVYNEALDMTKTAHKIEVEAFTPDTSHHFYALRNSYAMPNQEFVKKAAAYFVDYENEFMDAQDRHQFAANVLARAKELNVPLEQATELEKYASAEYGDILGVQIRMRQDLLQARPEMSAALEKIATYKQTLPPLEFAKLLFTFDKKASLSKYYGGYLADAFKSTFEQRITKKASGYTWESGDGELSCNEKELISAFEKKADKIKGYFGVTIADQLKKHGCQIFDSLPDDAKETIVKIAKGDL